MQVRSFGTPVRPLRGLLMRPPQARRALLLCRPVGLEGVRTTPMYRVIADRVGREQVATLRFDYFGTADAAGEEGEQSMAAWSEDVLEAQQLLVREVATDTAWFGMRLGANLALRAAAVARDPPSRLVLWDPVVSGQAYLEAILAAHRREAAGGKGMSWQKMVARGLEPEPRLPGNVLGFQFGAALVDELQRVEMPALGPALRRGINVTVATTSTSAEILRGQYGSPFLTLSVLGPQPDWSSSRAEGTPVAPADIFAALRRALELS